MSEKKQSEPRITRKPLIIKKGNEGDADILLLSVLTDGQLED